MKKIFMIIVLLVVVIMLGAQSCDNTTDDSICGNGDIDEGETLSSCPADVNVCGDGYIYVNGGEDCEIGLQSNGQPYVYEGGSCDTSTCILDCDEANMYYKPYGELRCKLCSGIGSYIQNNECIYVCQGTTPSHATLCPGDNTDVPSSLYFKRVVDSCSSNKCEYTCNSGYVAIQGIEGYVCQEISYCTPQYSSYTTSCIYGPNGDQKRATCTSCCDNADQYIYADCGAPAPDSCTEGVSFWYEPTSRCIDYADAGCFGDGPYTETCCCMINDGVWDVQVSNPDERCRRVVDSIDQGFIELTTSCVKPN